MIIFTVEYALRLWSYVAEPEYSRPVGGRPRFAVRPLLLVDLIAILPFCFPMIGVDLRFIRVLRLTRIARLAKVGRYYSALRLIGRVLKDRREELLLTLAIMTLLLAVSASLIYYVEDRVQPDVFPDVRAAMWRSVVTLTTVVHGDAYPETGLGKLLASMISILGIGTFALPTAIIGAGFIHELQKSRSGPPTGPHCGKETR